MAPTPSTSQLYDQLDRSIQVLERLYSNQARIAGLIATQLQQCHEIAQGLSANHPWSSDKEVIYRSVAADVGAAHQIPDRTMEYQMMDAARLVEDFPNTLAALLEGKIQARHSHVIQTAGARIKDPDIRAKFEQATLEYAPTTVGKLRVIAKRLAEGFAPQTIDERHIEAKKTCHVSVYQLDDGLAELVAVIPAIQAFAIKDRLDQYAFAANETATITTSNSSRLSGQTGTDTDTKTTTVPSSSSKAQETRIRLAQLRATFLTDLLLAGEVTCSDTCPAECGTKMNGKRSPGTGCGGLGNIQGRVMVTVPALNLLPPEQANKIRMDRPLYDQAGLAGPTQLNGYGPVDTATAQQIVGRSRSWLRLFIDPVKANLIQVDRYRPSQKQRSTLMARDMHCRFPGCMVAVFACDLDHTVDAALGGQTSNDNLEHLCRRHHTLKHQGGWNVNQTENGNVEWLSPIGRRYQEPPPSAGLFRPPPDLSQYPPPAQCDFNLGAEPPLLMPLPRSTRKTVKERENHPAGALLDEGTETAQRSAPSASPHDYSAAPPF